MNPAGLELSDHERELVARMAAHEAPQPASFNAQISREDEMFLRPLAMYGGNRNRTLWRYLSFGKLMATEVTQVLDWAFGGWDGVGSFLDFASGHGRFTRYLVQHMPASKVVVSDIYPDAMDYQSQNLGVRSVLSCLDPKDFDPGQRFDVIFVASLFSHLPEASFRAWLERLLSLLSDDGVLIFSTIGMDTKPAHLDASGGHAFLLESESRSLPNEVYGKTFTAPDFVAGLLAKHPQAPRHAYFANGFVGFQDLYVATLSPRHIRALDYRAGLMGHIAGIQVHGDASALGGWAADVGATEASVGVEVWVDEECVATATPDAERPDVAQMYGPSALRSGWSVRVPTEALPQDAWIRVAATRDDGASTTIALDTAQNMMGYLAR